ncbi:MAG: glucose-6-phosphate isomerase, partial [Myxococcota bacterium]
MTSPTERPAWRALVEHHAQMADVHMRDLFAADPGRFERYKRSHEDLLVDFSKHRMDDTTLALLLQLAGEVELPAWIERMFNGEAINTTEKRAVLHVALRNRGDETHPSYPMSVDGHDVMPDVNAVLAQMRTFSDAVRNGTHRGHTGAAITDIINIGIGGSDLGP